MTEKFVTIDQYQFLPEAQAIQMHLQAQGIQVMLADAETVATDWALGNAIGYIKLQVPQSQVEQARTVIDDWQAKRKQRQQASADQPDTNRCLACGAEMKQDQAACSQCGWSYDEADSEDSPTEAEDKSWQDRVPEDAESVMEQMTAMKKPLVMLLLAPALLAVVLLVFVLVMMFAERLLIRH